LWPPVGSAPAFLHGRARVAYAFDSQLRLGETDAQLDQNTSDDTIENNSRPSGSSLTHALIQHLLQAWNALSLRSLDRQPTAGTLDVTVGISSIHYHLAGRTDFAEFLDDQHRQPSSGPLGSLFNNRNLPISELTRTSPGSTKPTASLYELDELDELDSPAAPMVEAKKINELYPIYQVPLIDTSPGGYCIEWRDEIPSQVKAGELLGLLDPVRNYWSLGVVRWANLTQGATQLGIQILAPQAIPVAIALVQNSGDCSEFLRALEIPPISALGQPATLITNTISFREQSKARIYHRAQDSETQSADENIQLNRRCFATGAFNQFTYQNLAPTAPKVSEKSTLFDPEWDA